MKDLLKKRSPQERLMIAETLLDSAIKDFPSAQPEKRTEERTKTHACDSMISRRDAIGLADNLKDDLPDDMQIADAVIAHNEGILEYQTALSLLPSAEPERKTGRWILHENQRQEDVNNGNYLYICSECGKSDIHAKTQEVPFCWWCGAKMEVEHERR